MTETAYGNAELIRLALKDGPKAIGAVLKWCREHGSDSITMPVADIVLRRLQRDEEVRWDGEAWSLSDQAIMPAEPISIIHEEDQDSDPPESGPSDEDLRNVEEELEDAPPTSGEQTSSPILSPRICRDAEFSRLVGSSIGVETTIPIPRGVEPGRYSNNIRSMLHTRKETRGNLWSLRIAGDLLSVTRGAEKIDSKKEAKNDKPRSPQEKSILRMAAPESVWAVIGDLDGQIQELRGIKQRLLSLYDLEEDAHAG